ncbi:MAG: hypothetical protein CM1200mP25_3900 [Acidobacteriota bacterium]|nr:MAG: hypothetical protein CM1200mP25_3900 [Acidobacteriota bacterium]
MTSSGLKSNWGLAHYLKKLRLGLGGQLTNVPTTPVYARATLSRWSPATVLSEISSDRLLKLENAFGVDILNIYETLLRRSPPSEGPVLSSHSSHPRYRSIKTRWSGPVLACCKAW